MGYLTQADAIVRNATEVLNTIYSTNFTQFLQGLGLPAIGTWLNYNSTLSTAQNGTVDIDHLIGSESPVRYNMILGTPVYGLNRDLTPELTSGEGGLLDINMEIEVTLLPNAFKPNPYDYFIYEFGTNHERKILFRVNNVQLSSIKSNSYYKVNMHMVEIDSDNQINALLKQVVKTYRTDLDRIGTNDNCIIENTVFNKCKDIKKMTDYIVSQYTSLFYSERYNSVLYKSSAESSIVYDPYLTNFIIHAKFFETSKGDTTVVVLDQDYTFRPKYNLTFYRAIETREIRDIKETLYWQPQHFTRSTVNPFSYYAEEFAYKIDVYNDAEAKGIGREYQQYPFIENIHRNKTDFLNGIEAGIVRYFNSEDSGQLFTDADLEWIDQISLEYTPYWYELTPILVFLLKQYYDALRDSY